MSPEMKFPQSVLINHPYPIARPASNFNNTSEPEDRFAQLEFLAEMIVRYLGVIAVSNYQRDGLSVARIQYLLSRLSWPDWDIWLDLLSAILQLYRSRPDEFVVPKLISAYTAPLGPDSEIFKACQWLTIASALDKSASQINQVTLDDFFSLLAANRRIGWIGPPGVDKDALLQTLFPAFVELLEHLPFLTKYRLGYIENVVMSEGEEDRYHILAFTGNADTPQPIDIPPIPEDVYLELQQVYLCDTNMLPLLGLHPLLVVEGQLLYILYQNENNENILYVHCGDSTRDPYKPDMSAGYSIGGLTFVGGSLDWPEQRRDIAPIVGDTVLQIAEPEQEPNLKEIIASQVDQQADLSILGQSLAAEEKGGNSQEQAPPHVAYRNEAYRRSRFERLDREVGVPSMHWLEFSTSAYLADLGVTVEDIQSGSILGPYCVLDKIGQGPVADVYRAELVRSLLDDHQVVLRILKQHIMDQVLHRELNRELRSWWLLSQQRQPNILGLTMISKTRDGRFILELERFEGTPLTHLLGEKPDGFPLSEGLNIAVQVCRALVAAHKIELVHRRIKPSNILVGEGSDPRVKVTDFGMSEEMASFLLTSDEDSLVAVESLPYLPPEYFLDTPIPKKSESMDIYSVGVLLYYLFTGSLPFQDKSLSECEQRIKRGECKPNPITPKIPDFPLELERLVKRAMHPEPYRRYQHIDVLLRELESIERSIDAVYAVSQILMDNVPEEGLDSFLSRRSFIGPNLKSKVMQYCLRAENLEDVLDLLGVIELEELCEEKDLKSPAFSREEYVTFLLEEEGVYLPHKPEGLPQSIQEAEELLHRVRSASTREIITGSVVDAGKECEKVLQNLIQFHTAFLFHDAWLEVVCRDLLKWNKLAPARFSKLGLHRFLQILAQLNDLVSADPLFRRVFHSDAILEFQGIWKHNIPKYRNDHAHYNSQMANKTIEELRMIGYEYIKTVLDFLEALRQARTYPKVVVVRETALDCYGRRLTQCLGDDGKSYEVYTSQDLQPGKLYFFYSQSEPISVNPVLLPCEQ